MYIPYIGDYTNVLFGLFVNFLKEISIIVIMRRGPAGKY